MATLTANINASTREIPTDATAGFYELGAELVQLVEAVPPAVPFTDPPTGRMYAKRGVGDSTPVSHSSGATLTRYDPKAPGGEGGGGVTSVNGQTGVVVLRAAYIDPTTATPEAHVQATIDADLMDGPP